MSMKNVTQVQLARGVVRLKVAVTFDSHSSAFPIFIVNERAHPVQHTVSHSCALCNMSHIHVEIPCDHPPHDTSHKRAHLCRPDMVYEEQQHNTHYGAHHRVFATSCAYIRMYNTGLINIACTVSVCAPQAPRFQVILPGPWQ